MRSWHFVPEWELGVGFADAGRAGLDDQVEVSQDRAVVDAFLVGDEVVRAGAGIRRASPLGASRLRGR